VSSFTPIICEIFVRCHIFEYGNANIPEDIQGESFRNIVNQKTAKGRDAIYYTYYEYPSVHMVKRHYGVRT
jgi:hypothetical protein